MSRARLLRVVPAPDPVPTPPQPSLPVTPRRWLARPRLTRLLDEGRHRRLTVVIGGPGTGKSAVLAGWARERLSGTTAWLGLEQTDNEPGRFRTRLQTALQALHPALLSLVPGISTLLPAAFGYR